MFSKKYFKSFTYWLHIAISKFKQKAAGFYVRIDKNKKHFSAELIATASFDKTNNDWVRDEIYASLTVSVDEDTRRHMRVKETEGKEFVFKAKDQDRALDFIKNELRTY